MHTAVFDIGKTNKKFSIFDENLNEIHRIYVNLPQTVDEDEFPTEDLPLLTAWMRETLSEAMQSPEFKISKLNFSTYGASFVHLDYRGRPLTPLYNYLKPFPDTLWEAFYQLTGGKDDFCVRTASPALGMLNSGLQLYWFQQERPDTFAQIKHSLHFPQYCSYLFSSKLWTEYTSIGCHTGLWDFTQNSYHTWLDHSQISKLFPANVPATSQTQVLVNGQKVGVGTGMHDSSAALLPYLFTSKEPFLLLSTGTWNITFNPFNRDLLTLAELNKDCLNYLRMDGQPIKASRLFFGNEFNIQTKKMAERFDRVGQKYHHVITFDEALYQKWSVVEESLFQLESIQYPDGSIRSAAETRWDLFPTFEEAYHRLMIEMMRLQAKAIQLAAGTTGIKKIFVDGGFSQSDVFLHLLRIYLPGFEIIISPSPLGSSLGAAMAIGDSKTVENYQFEKRRVLI